ncbi:hypothetical protein CQW23_01236 [Capsicum baccatum]|uniref:Integrase zinc-binding domain-containing protein n=1 Tax=Capsicum baccatum TaxID=33114 RepID=A0A2G2XN03_CAPBA|nr:hypothetical protein CQW23_01236 [Capsicum baccatum]
MHYHGEKRLEMLFVISQPEVLIFEEVRAKVKQSPILQELQAKIEQGEMNSDWVFRDRLLFFKDRVHLSPNSPLVNFVLSGIHDSTHEGVQKTMLRIRKDFYWPAMKTTIKDYVAACSVCQRNKAVNLSPTG